MEFISDLDMNDLLIFASVFLAMVCLFGAIVVVLTTRRRALAPRLGMQTSTGAGASAGIARGLTNVGRTVSLGPVSSRLKAHLAKAGYHSDSAAMTYMGTKLMLLVFAGTLTAALVLPLTLPAPFGSVYFKAYLVVMAAVLFFFIPNLVISSRRRKRSTEIKNQLPNAIDLLEVCVSAGMGLDMAWNAVSDEIRHVSATIADEMALVNLEMQLGIPRTDALRNMAERTGAAELSSLVALLVQSDRFGTSIADALRTYASSMRDQRSQRAEEVAEKMAVKLLFPLVFLIFPVMLVVMAGPAAITLIDMLGS